MIATLETPCGPLWVSGGADVVDAVSWTSIQGLRHHGELDWVMHAFSAYFTGTLRDFPGGILFMGPGVLWTRNHTGARPMAGSQHILAAISQIPYGSTTTYGDIACRVGKPRAARAVGSVCRANPLPILIPCHRVVGSTSLGGYTPGIRIKERLLKIESGGS